MKDRADVPRDDAPECGQSRWDWCSLPKGHEGLCHPQDEQQPDLDLSLIKRLPLETELLAVVEAAKTLSDVEFNLPDFLIEPWDALVTALDTLSLERSAHHAAQAARHGGTDLPKELHRTTLGPLVACRSCCTFWLDGCDEVPCSCDEEDWVADPPLEDLLALIEIARNFAIYEERTVSTVGSSSVTSRTLAMVREEERQAADRVLAEVRALGTNTDWRALNIGGLYRERLRYEAWLAEHPT